ncbi:CDP-diacylglycerol--glycerol-3-phosphate 3-phosphatidyltransferase [Gammaproteobacteria bacterium]|nr:CDP-diacylglycerol--glycerol-3-phosphate 3-phosphatidyltransferase [Gammaproteobacteria bacterium]
MKFFINFLTIFRLFSGPIIFAMLLLTFNPMTAFILFIIASLSDYFDGYLARKYFLESTFGEVLDPIADKILTLFLLLTLMLHFQSPFIGMVGGVILAREFWVSALRDLNARKSNLNATKVTFLAKVKTSSQFLTFATFLFGILINNSLIIFLSNILLFFAMILSLKTALNYTQATFQD